MFRFGMRIFDHLLFVRGLNQDWRANCRNSRKPECRFRTAAHKFAARECVFHNSTLRNEHKFWCVYQCPDDVFHAFAPLGLESFGGSIASPDLVLQLLLDPRGFWIQMV